VLNIKKLRIKNGGSYMANEETNSLLLLNAMSSQFRSDVQ